MPCGTRHETKCPACAERYRRDAFHIVRDPIPTKLQPGQHIAFITLTAPGSEYFGTAHHFASKQGGKRTCPCGQRHTVLDPIIGAPINNSSFRYDRAARWNGSLPELWKRTTTSIQERFNGYSVQFVRVIEMQARGLAHVHALFVFTPNGEFGIRPARLIRQSLRQAILSTHVGDVAWGRILHIRFLGAKGRSGAPSSEELEKEGLTGQARELSKVAGYIAKYATKGPEHALKNRQVGPELREHLDALRKAANIEALSWNNRQSPIVELDPMQRWRSEKVRATRREQIVYSFGFGGHFLSKSSNWGLTFKEIRSRRRRHAASAGSPGTQTSSWTLHAFGLEAAHEFFILQYWSSQLQSLGYDPPVFLPF